jgi:glycosyltransferase involved in cell wall biosynthesis
VATIHHPIGIDREADFGQARSRLERLRRRWFYSFYIPMQTRVARCVDRVVTVSECSAREIVRLIGIPPDRISVVYNGVDASVFCNRNGIVKEPKSVIFVGNTEDRKKGIKHLLQALTLLKDEVQVRLTIVDGGAPETTYAPALAREYGLEGQIRIVRRLSGEDLVHQYSTAEIAAVPSLFEGFGFPAAEAMACQLPVITTRAGALPELVSDGENGVLVEPGSVSELASAIRLLLGDDDLRRRMGDAGRDIVRRKFSWEQAARQTVEAYQQARQ